MAKKDLIAPLAVIVVLALIFLPGFSRYQKVSAECRKLKAEIEALQKANAQLEKEKYKLEHDIEYVEKRARNKLGVVKKGEIPYKKVKEEEKDEQ
ncbi:MAG: septum formation initiator family protein [Candidatus Omnitrophota bacterium]|nr:septum formation initiator family protein [Candidatus Omnitrophota bacterium]